MPAPYLQTFTVSLAGGPVTITSVVLDQGDYDALIDELAGHPLGGLDNAAWAKNCAALRAARHIPMVERGTKTDWLFARLGVPGERLSVVVRGHGKVLARQLLDGE